LSEVNNAVHSTFNAFAQTILVDSTRGRTLEHLVGEMVRPMLKSWLDDNLPTLVECLVRTEIERISPPGERGERHRAS
jgi:cell pole-organizing protein PopZ